MLFLRSNSLTFFLYHFAQSLSSSIIRNEQSRIAGYVSPCSGSLGIQDAEDSGFLLTILLFCTPIIHCMNLLYSINRYCSTHPVSLYVDTALVQMKMQTEPRYFGVWVLQMCRNIHNYKHEIYTPKNGKNELREGERRSSAGLKSSFTEITSHLHEPLHIIWGLEQNHWWMTLHMLYRQWL